MSVRTASYLWGVRLEFVSGDDESKLILQDQCQCVTYGHCQVLAEGVKRVTAFDQAQILYPEIEVRSNVEVQLLSDEAQQIAVQDPKEWHLCRESLLGESSEGLKMASGRGVSR